MGRKITGGLLYYARNRSVITERDSYPASQSNRSSDQSLVELLPDLQVLLFLSILPVFFFLHSFLVFMYGELMLSGLCR